MEKRGGGAGGECCFDCWYLLGKEGFEWGKEVLLWCVVRDCGDVGVVALGRLRGGGWSWWGLVVGVGVWWDGNEAGCLAEEGKHCGG